MPAPPTEPGGEAGRVRCLYCGANNFPASAVCWQCSRPLKAMPIQAMPTGPAPGGASVPAGAVFPAVRPALSESPLASKAAAAMGLLFPWFGLPAGMIFLMLDDPRKTQIGWLLIGWSLAGSVINIVALAVTLGPLWAVLRGLLPHFGAPVPSPGLPDTSGGDGLFLLLACL